MEIKRAVPFLALFASFGTLVCCALPALFVMLGLGAAFAGLLGAVPQLIWFSEHKFAVFAAGASLLTAAFIMQRRDNSCPADPAQAAACERMRRIGRRTLHLSLLLYGVGAFFAFIAPHVL